MYIHTYTSFFARHLLQRIHRCLGTYGPSSSANTTHVMSQKSVGFLVLEDQNIGGFFRICRFIPFDVYESSRGNWSRKKGLLGTKAPQWDMNDERWVVFFVGPHSVAMFFLGPSTVRQKAFEAPKRNIHYLSQPPMNFCSCAFLGSHKKLASKKMTTKQQNNNHCHYYMFLRYVHSKNTFGHTIFHQHSRHFPLFKRRLSAFEPENFTRFTLEKQVIFPPLNQPSSKREIHLFLWEIPCFNGGISIAMS